MNKLASLAAALWLAAALVSGPAVAQDAAPGADTESDLPFKRTFGIAGVISGSLEESALAAGVPARALAELLPAVIAVVDLDNDVHDGDRFYIRYERTFNLENAPIDDGRVLWAELQFGKKRTVALHRFRPMGAARDSFWLANGQGAMPAQLRFPLPSFVVSSGFGLRVDPLDQPAMLNLGPAFVGASTLGKGPTRARGGLPPALGSPGTLPSVNVATPLGLSLGLAPGASTARLMTATRGLGGSVGGVMALHEGVDLVAPYGSPILAAGDGVVKGAEPKGRYGNWIEIDHPGDLATVYGHLARFAPGIAAGTEVSQGEVIGFIGLTGRTTGPHVHFEVRFKGRPVNPMVYSALKSPQLRGRDLDHFRKLVASDLADREREAKTASAGL